MAGGSFILSEAKCRTRLVWRGKTHANFDAPVCCFSKRLQQEKPYHDRTLLPSFCLFLLAPILLGRLPVSTVKMPTKMSLIAEAGFGCYLGDRALHTTQTEHFFREAQPVLQDILMRV